MFLIHASSENNPTSDNSYLIGKIVEFKMTSFFILDDFNAFMSPSGSIPVASYSPFSTFLVVGIDDKNNVQLKPLCKDEGNQNLNKRILLSSSKTFLNTNNYTIVG